MDRSKVDVERMVRGRVEGCRDVRNVLYCMFNVDMS
jgi:hypothetical protein